MVKASTLPLFQGTMRLDTSRSLPKSHYWGSMLSQKEVEQRNQEIQKAITLFQQKVNTLPDSMELVYIPSRQFQTPYSYMNSDGMMINGIESSVQDQIIIHQKTGLEALAGFIVFSLTGQSSGKSYSLERHGIFDSWKFWKTESVDAFIKRAIETASGLAKRQDQSN
jgi:hypothetical protein